MGGAVLNGGTHVLRQGFYGGSGAFHLAVREMLRLYKAQHIGGAAIGDGDAFAAFQADAHIVAGVAGLGGEELHPGLVGVGDVIVNGVLQAGDVGASGTNVHHAGLVGPHHASSRHPQDPDVQRADVGGVPAQNGVIHCGTAVFDDADIGGCASNLKIDAVGSPQVHKGPHDAGGGARKHGENGALPHFADVHDAAVPPHDH